MLAVAILGSAISACDKITERKGERGRERALSEREWLTAQLDHPTAKDRFPHFTNEVVMKQTEQLAPAHTRSLTFRVEKRFLIPNL